MYYTPRTRHVGEKQVAIALLQKMKITAAIRMAEAKENDENQAAQQSKRNNT